jgi:transposase
VHRFNEGGIEALKDKPRAGRPSRLSASQQSRLKAIILDESPEQHGFNSGTWSAPLIAALIKGLFEVSYGKAQVYNLLHSLGLSHQKGKAFYPEATTEDNALMREALKKTPMP